MTERAEVQWSLRLENREQVERELDDFEKPRTVKLKPEIATPSVAGITTDIERLLGRAKPLISPKLDPSAADGIRREFEREAALRPPEFDVSLKLDSADIGALQREVRQASEQVERAGQIDFGDPFVNLTRDAQRAARSGGLRDLSTRLQGLRDEAFINGRVDVDPSELVELQATLRTVRRQAEEDIQIRVDVPESGVPIRLNKDAIDRQVDDIERQLRALDNVPVDPLNEFSTAAARRDVEHLRDDLQRLQRSAHITGDVELDDHELREFAQRAERVQREFRDIDIRVDVNDSQLSGLTSRLGSVRGVLGGAALGFGLFEGAQLAGRGITSALNASSALNESLNLAERQFGDLSGQAVSFGRNAADSLGLSTAAAIQNQAAFGGLLRNVGFVNAEALRASQNLVTVSSDMASAFDTNVPEALDAIRSGLVGQSEPLRRYNVFLNEAAVYQEALRLGLVKSRAELDDYSKTQARLSIITQQTASIQGDFADTAEDQANALRRAQANAENTAAIFGDSLKPVVEDLARTFNDDLVPVLQEFAKSEFPGLIADMSTLAGLGIEVAVALNEVNNAVKSIPGASSALRFLSGRYLVDGFRDAREAVDDLNNAIESIPGASSALSFLSGRYLIDGYVDAKEAVDDLANADKKAAAASEIHRRIAERNQQAHRAQAAAQRERTSAIEADARATLQAARDEQHAIRQLSGVYDDYIADGQTAAEATQLLAAAMADGTASTAEFTDIARETGLSAAQIAELFPDAAAEVERWREEAAAAQGPTERLRESITGLDGILSSINISDTGASGQDFATFFEGLEGEITSRSNHLKAVALLELQGLSDLAAAVEVTPELSDDVLNASVEQLRTWNSQISGVYSRSILDAENFKADLANALFGINDSISNALGGGASGFGLADAGSFGIDLGSVIDTDALAGPIGEMMANGGAAIEAQTPVVAAATTEVARHAVEEFGSSFDIQAEATEVLGGVQFPTDSLAAEARRAGVTVGSALGEGMASGVGRTGALVSAAARSVAARAAAAIRAQLDINSPSRVGIAIGENFGSSLAMGLGNMESMVGAQAAQVGRVMASAVRPPSGTVPTPADVRRSRRDRDAASTYRTSNDNRTFNFPVQDSANAQVIAAQTRRHIRTRR